ncbi:hypothetical protein YC2023_026077 [Brassica napus]
MAHLMITRVVFCGTLTSKSSLRRQRESERIVSSSSSSPIISDFSGEVYPSCNFASDSPPQLLPPPPPVNKAPPPPPHVNDSAPPPAPDGISQRLTEAHRLAEQASVMVNTLSLDQAQRKFSCTPRRLSDQYYSSNKSFTVGDHSSFRSPKCQPR